MMFKKLLIAGIFMLSSYSCTAMEKKSIKQSTMQPVELSDEVEKIVTAIRNFNEKNKTLILSGISQYAEHRKIFTHEIFYNFHQIIKSEAGLDIINQLVKEYPIHIQEFIKKESSSFINNFINTIIANIKLLLAHEGGITLLKLFIKNDFLLKPDIYKIFEAEIAKNMEKMPFSLFIELIMKKENIHSNSPLHNAITILNSYHPDNFFKVLLYETITKKHAHPLLANYETLFKSMSNTHRSVFFEENRELGHLFQQVMWKARQLIDQDYYIFLHGQRRDHYLSEKLFSLLWYIQNNKPYDDSFLFAHVKNPVVTAVELEFENKMRNQLLVNGRTEDTRYEREQRNYLLFMNYAFFGNLTQEGSCTFELILNNHNFNDITLSPENIFRLFNLNHIYEQFQKEINGLLNKYNGLSPYGNLLLIAIPKNKIKECIFPALPNGNLKYINIEGIGPTSDIKLIMETIYEHPEKINDNFDLDYLDYVEFCLIMTHKNGGLDPDMGIKVIPFVTGDYEKVEELKKKEDALFAKIAAAIKQPKAKL